MTRRGELNFRLPHRGTSGGYEEGGCLLWSRLLKWRSRAVGAMFQTCIHCAANPLRDQYFDLWKRTPRQVKMCDRPFFFSLLRLHLGQLDSKMEVTTQSRDGKRIHLGLMGHRWHL